MTFNRSKEEVTSLALIPSILVALSDSVEWMPSLDCSESSRMSTTLTQSASDDAIAGAAIALGEGEVVALATFTFFEGSIIGSVCQLDLFGLRLCDARMAAFCSSSVNGMGFLRFASSHLSIYPSVLVGLVPTRNENLLVVLDLDDVLPAAGETVGTRGLIEDKDVEVTVNRPLGV